jgi:hypothetical protein
VRAAGYARGRQTPWLVVLSIGFYSPCVMVRATSRSGRSRSIRYTGACLEKQVYIWTAVLQKRGLYSIQATPLKKQVYIWASLLQKHGMSMSICGPSGSKPVLYMGRLLRNRVYIGAFPHRSRSIYQCGRYLTDRTKKKPEHILMTSRTGRNLGIVSAACIGLGESLPTAAAFVVIAYGCWSLP